MAAETAHRKTIAYFAEKAAKAAAEPLLLETTKMQTAQSHGDIFARELVRVLEELLVIWP